jgi:hypothetical protein
VSRSVAAALALSVSVLACAPSPVAPVTSPTATAVAVASPIASSSASAAPTAEAAVAAVTASPTVIAFPSCRGPDVTTGRAVCIPGARIDIDAAIDDADAAAIVAQVIADLAAVQAEFEWTLRGTARIDVYATRATYTSGLQTVFGYSRATAEYLADNSVAFFEPSLTRIAVSWEEVRDRRPIAAIRHELTHVVTLEACQPRCDLVPAWVNEGQARLAEALIPGADWRMLRVRYEAASMVSTKTLIPLTSLWTQGQWNAYGDWDGYYKYQEAARAVQLLRADIGDRAVPRLYARIRAGADLATAYAALSGKSFASFTAALPSRLTEGVPSGPAIVTVTPGADGKGTSFLLYGYPADASVTLRLRARHLDESQELKVSPQGAYFGSIDDTYPPGAYTIATAGLGAAVTVTKRGGRTSLASP